MHHATVVSRTDQEGTVQAPQPQEPQPFGTDATIVWRTFVTILMLVALVLAVIAVREDDAASATNPGGRSGAGGAVGSADSTISVMLSEFSLDVSPATVPSGHVTVDVMNMGTMEHDLTLEDGPTTGTMAAATNGTLDLGDLAPGTYTLLCTIAGHQGSGMESALTVTDGGAAPAAASGEGATSATASDDPDWAAMDAAMDASLAAFPAETEGVGNQELVPEVLADGTRVFDLTAAITPWEVTPGNVVDAWTYNGMVPGPIIRGEVGDRVRIVLHNETPANTDLHFHGIRVPNLQDGVAPLTQPNVAPGETYTYEFTLEEPAVGMYHAHAHAEHSVVNGMLGAFIVGEMPLPEQYVPAGTTIDQEIPMVVNDAGVLGLSLNGKGFPATAPIVANVGDWIEIHYMNEGLQIHPMHLHGFPQLVIAKDGIPLDAPYYADTVNIAPGERYTVLINPDLPGAWVWHCHILTHAESDEGLHGMVTALIVEDPDAGS
jgi:manganese oxidase